MAYPMSMYSRKHFILQGKNLYSCFMQFAREHTEVRVRFAPSPTGKLHIGGARTALYNYLFAKANNGKFILRMEDTNELKNIPNMDIELENQLHLLNIPPDESPIIGGKYGPYKQSDRMDIYKTYSDILLANKSAYKCFCNQELQSAKYNNFCRSLSDDHIKSYEEKQEPFCIRFKLRSTYHKHQDIVYGSHRSKPQLTNGDPVIMRSSGSPTFYLASVIDDYLMKISHVFRGAEWLTQINLIHSLYKAFDWPLPKFGHLPQMMNKEDRSKLSKRHGAPDIGSLLADGYSPEVIFNAATMAGGGFGKEDVLEFLSLEDMIGRFKIEKLKNYSAPWENKTLQKLGKIDIQMKLSQKDARENIIKDLREAVMTTHKENLKIELSDKYMSSVLEVIGPRANTFKGLCTDFNYFWTNNIVPTKEAMVNFDTTLADKLITAISEVIEKLPSDQFNLETIKQSLEAVRQESELIPVVFFNTINVCFYGSKSGPSISEVFMLLGKDEVLGRLEKMKYKNS